MGWMRWNSMETAPRAQGRNLYGRRILVSTPNHGKKWVCIMRHHGPTDRWLDENVSSSVSARADDGVSRCQVLPDPHPDAMDTTT